MKPSNLMITGEGKIKLADFGIAKDLDATALTATGRTLGSAAYMSPEQIRGTPAVSHKTDLYALGVVLYQMLVGKPPFEGRTPVVLMHCHLNEPPPRPSAKLVDIPRKLDDLVVSLMAKLPKDRPWDSAAVAAKLTELREKADRGAAVAMVWPSNGEAAANPPRTAAPAQEANSAVASPEHARTKKAKAGSANSNRSGAIPEDHSSWLNRSMLETGVLVSALVVIGGIIAYLVWPPSAEYLYRHAEPLMASESRSDWDRAIKEYIDPLDNRFKDHPYRDQTRNWRDKVLLNNAENRAKYLTSGLKTTFSEPADDAERKFVIAYELAQGASNRKDDRTEISFWRDLSEQVSSSDKVPAERKWYLLALNRVQQLENAINDRRGIIEKQWQIAEAAFQSGRLEEAEDIKKTLIEQYGKYTSLADVFCAIRLSVGSAPKTPEPTPPASIESAGSEKTNSSKPKAPTHP